MTDTPTSSQSREERLAKLAAARAATARRTDVDPTAGAGSARPESASTVRPRRSRAASGARIVVGAASVAGFTVMTQAMGPLVAPAESETITPQAAEQPTTQPSVVVRLVDENGDPIASDGTAATTTTDLSTESPSAAPVAGAPSQTSSGASTSAPAPAPAAQTSSPSQTRPSVPPAMTSAPTPAAPSAPPAPAPAPTAPPTTAAPPPPTTVPPPPRSSASG